MKNPYTQRVKKKFVGTYRSRIDGREKANGSAQFLDDIALGTKFPGLLYAKVLRSPYPNARITHLDVSGAEKMDGVAAVLTFKDAEVAFIKNTSCAWTSVNTASCDKVYFPGCKDRKVLSDRVRWVGDEAGVVVAAESEQTAEAALKQIDVTWEVLPFALTVEDALKADAPIIHPEINSNGNVLPTDASDDDHVFFTRGDTEKIFHQAHVVTNVTTHFHNADHSCLDTRGCLMEWKNDRLTCWTNYYQADQTRMHISQMLEIPLHKVRVKNPYVGASMGRSNTGEQLFFLFTAILAKRTGRPVKFKHTRREDFHDTRNAVSVTVKLAAEKDGTITGAHFKAIGDSGAYAEHSLAAVQLVPALEFPECLLAHIPNLKMEGFAVYTNKIPGSCMRGIGNIQYNFAIGRAIDELSELLEIDPLAIVVKNFGHEFEAAPNLSLQTVLQEGARRIGWDRRHKPGKGPMIDGSKKRGIGMSFHCSWHAAWQELPRGHIQVGVRVNPDLTVILEAPQVETGPGSNSCAVFACAEALHFLEITPEDIHWVPVVDTDTGYKDMVQTDSAVSYLQAELMPEIAQMVKSKILEMAAPDFETDPENLDIQEGIIFLKKNSAIKLPVSECLWQGDLVPILVTLSKTLPPEKTGIPFVATFVEVEVDMESGKIDVRKVIPVHDCGTVMFASGAEGQLVGGQGLGIGEALYEEIIYDKETGVPLNFNLIDYSFPTMLDFPEVEPVLLEIWRGAGEYGACGTGEVASTCLPRAISNAVYNAVGVRIDDIPLKPEKVLHALRKINE